MPTIESQADATSTPYWTALWVRGLLGLALAVTIVIAGYVTAGGLDGGLDGPCLGEAEFTTLPEGTSASEHSTLWPPETVCEVELPTGETRVERYPERHTWWIAGGALAAVILLPIPAVARARRRRSPPR